MTEIEIDKAIIRLLSQKLEDIEYKLNVLEMHLRELDQKFKQIKQIKLIKTKNYGIRHR